MRRAGGTMTSWTGPLTAQWIHTEAVKETPQTKTILYGQMKEEMQRKAFK